MRYPPPAYTQQVHYPAPVYAPSPGGSRAGVIVGAVLGGVVVLVLLTIAAITLLGQSSSDTSVEVPPSVETGAPTPSSIFTAIQGYRYGTVPASHIDAFNNGILSETGGQSVGTTDGRTLLKGNTTVAEAIVIVYDEGIVVDQQAGLSALASNSVSHEDATIAGGNGVYFKTSDGAQGLFVFKDRLGLAMIGRDRATMQDVAQKLLAHV